MRGRHPTLLLASNFGQVPYAIAQRRGDQKQPASLLSNSFTLHPHPSSPHQNITTYHHIEPSIPDSHPTPYELSSWLVVILSSPRISSAALPRARSTLTTFARPLWSLSVPVRNSPRSATIASRPWPLPVAISALAKGLPASNDSKSSLRICSETSPNQSKSMKPHASAPSEISSTSKVSWVRSKVSQPSIDSLHG